MRAKMYNNVANGLAECLFSDDDRSNQIEIDDESNSDYSQSGEIEGHSSTSSLASLEGVSKDKATGSAPMWARPKFACLVVLLSSLYLGVSGNMRSMCSWVTAALESNEVVKKMMHAGAYLEVAAHFYLPPPWNAFFLDIENVFPGAFIISCVATILGLLGYGAVRLATKTSHNEINISSPRMYCANRMTLAKFQDKGPTIRAVVQLLASEEFKEYSKNKSQHEAPLAPVPVLLSSDDPKSQWSEA